MFYLHIRYFIDEIYLLFCASFNLEDRWDAHSSFQTSPLIDVIDVASIT